MTPPLDCTPDEHGQPWQVVLWRLDQIEARLRTGDSTFVRRDLYESRHAQLDQRIKAIEDATTEAARQRRTMSGAVVVALVVPALEVIRTLARVIGATP